MGGSDHRFCCVPVGLAPTVDACQRVQWSAEGKTSRRSGLLWTVGPGRSWWLRTLVGLGAEPVRSRPCLRPRVARDKPMKKAPADAICRGFFLPQGLVNSPGSSSDHFFSLAIESCRALSGSSAAGAAASLGAELAPSMPAVGSVASGAPAASGMVASISMRTLSRS